MSSSLVVVHTGDQHLDQPTGGCLAAGCDMMRSYRELHLDFVVSSQFLNKTTEAAGYNLSSKRGRSEKSHRAEGQRKLTNFPFQFTPSF